MELIYNFKGKNGVALDCSFKEASDILYSLEKMIKFFGDAKLEDTEVFNRLKALKATFDKEADRVGERID